MRLIRSHGILAVFVLIAVLLLVAGCGPKVNPSVILDGSIAYTVKRDDVGYVVITDPQGESEELYSGDETIRGIGTFYEPCLSPDQTRLIAVATIQGLPELVMIEFGSPPTYTRITNNRYFEGSPIFTPDGDHIIYSSDIGGDLELYRLNISDYKAVAECLTASHGDDTDPVISPDGRFLVYCSDEPGAYDLFCMDLTGEEPTRRLTDEEGDIASPSFSPDGEFIVYEILRAGNLDIGYVDFENPEHNGYLITEDSSDYSPSVSPDGEYLCVISSRDGQNDLCLYTWSGDFVRRITDNKDFEMEARWSFLK